jgi:hypothetical protein
MGGIVGNAAKRRFYDADVQYLALDYTPITVCGGAFCELPHCMLSALT